MPSTFCHNAATPARSVKRVLLSAYRALGAEVEVVISSKVCPNALPMKPQRYHSLGLAVVSSLLVLLSGSNVVGTSSSSSPSSGCTDSSTSDGDCDLSNNTEECGRLDFSNRKMLRTSTYSGALWHTAVARLGRRCEASTTFTFASVSSVFPL